MTTRQNIPCIGTTEVDFGATPVDSGTFTITDDFVSTASLITAVAAYTAPTGKDLDELEMDQLNIICGGAVDGAFSMFITAVDGSYLEGTFKVNYTINH